MNAWDRQQRASQFEGWAFTFCKAAFLVLLFQRWSLLALSGLAAVCYLGASLLGCTRWRCWAKPPWVTIFWAGIFAWQVWTQVLHRHL